MSVFRVNKNSNYTIMSNYHFRDNRLSLKAKGLLSEMLSLPDDWDYSLAGLVSINKEEAAAIKSALGELKDAGYVTITRLNPNETNSKKIEWVYDIYETPIQCKGNQSIENQSIENQSVENQMQLNTNKQNTKEQMTDDNTGEKISNDDIKRIIAAWNELGLAKIIKIPKNTERYKSLSARVSEYSVEEVLQAIARIRKSRFLKGSNDKHWKISFDWFVRPNRFPRVLEGNYDDEEEDLF